MATDDKTTTAKAGAPNAETQDRGEGGSVTIELSPQVTRALKQNVTFQTDQAMSEFVGDAVASYLRLGSLVAGGASVYVQKAKDTPLVPVRFPFNTTDAEEG
jgi:hypothetical protein